MASTKVYGQTGVANDLQFGKQGPRVIVQNGNLTAYLQDGSTLTNVSGANAVNPQDFVTLTQLQTVQTSVVGTSVELGTPTNTSLTGGAVTLTPTTSVTDSIDELNSLLALLVPTSPPSWPSPSTFTLSGTGSWQVASGTLTDNTGGGAPAAGSTVSSIFTSTISSNVVGGAGNSGSGPGTTGTMTALLNGASIGSHTLVASPVGANNGTYGSLVLSGNVSYPSATPGFWEVIQAQISNATLPAGYNKLQITHSAANNTAIDFVLYDNGMTAKGNATVTSGATAASGSPTPVYSSSVPHYNSTGGNTTSVVVTGNANNLSSLVYKATGILTVVGVASNANYVAIAPSTSFNAGQASIPSPVAQNAGATPFSATVALSDTHSKGYMQATAFNPNGGTATSINNPVILVMGSSTTSRIMEQNILVTRSGSLSSTSPNSNNAARVSLSGDTGVNTPTGTPVAWTSSAALNAWDATVTGGVLQWDNTNYSAGYLPVGPNLSSRSSGATQYVTFMFECSAVSKFDIKFTGTVAGCWVQLPGVTNATYTGNNNWRDMSLAFGNGYGCALSGAIPLNTLVNAGSYTCTFGTDSSTNSTGNEILIRFALTTGQNITALQFLAASH